MATILNAYNLSGGDTTSSTFTYSGATRDLDVEIITTSIGGDSTRVTIETSADQTTWVLVPNSEIQINKGSDSYVYHITESEGAYVRAKLYVNDSRSGTMTITAAEPSAGDGIPVTGTPYKAIQYDVNGDAQETTRFTDDFGVNSVGMTTRELFANDGVAVNIEYSNHLGAIFATVINNGSIANDAAAGVFGLTAGQLYYTNVAGEGILKIKI